VTVRGDTFRRGDKGTVDVMTLARADRACALRPYAIVSGNTRQPRDLVGPNPQVHGFREHERRWREVVERHGLGWLGATHALVTASVETSSGLPDAAEVLETRIVLHVARADLDAVGVLGHQVGLLLVHRFRHHGESGFPPRHGQQLEGALPHPLEGVR
jgi:hypothetical protein